MDIAEKLVHSGWTRERFEIIVIEPELENWIWQDSPHLADVFGFKLHNSLKMWLQEQGAWSANDTKPARPKEAVELTLRAAGTPVSASLYRELASKIGIKNCSDPAFQRLCERLRDWFPPNVRA